MRSRGSRENPNHQSTHGQFDGKTKVILGIGTEKTRTPKPGIVKQSGESRTFCQRNRASRGSQDTQDHTHSTHTNKMAAESPAQKAHSRATNRSVPSDGLAGQPRAKALRRRKRAQETVRRKPEKHRKRTQFNTRIRLKRTKYPETGGHRLKNCPNPQARQAGKRGLRSEEARHRRKQNRTSRRKNRRNNYRAFKAGNRGEGMAIPSPTKMAHDNRDDYTAEFNDFHNHNQWLARQAGEKAKRGSKAEKRTSKHKTGLKPGKQEIKIATLNVQGLNEISKRQEIEKWCEDNSIDILVATETKINTNATETRGIYQWFFATGVNHKDREIVEAKRAKNLRPTPAEWRKAAEHHGVAIMVKRKLTTDIEAIEPLNGRILKMQFKTTPKLNVVAAYAPHAARPAEEKEQFYTRLAEETEKIPKGHVCLILGDFNAKLYGRTSEETDIVGEWCLGADEARREGMTADTKESREIFTMFLLDQDLVAKNTTFKKTPRELITYRSHGAEGWEPVEPPRFEQIDYVLARRPWTNAIQDVTNDTKAGLSSDHYPLTARVKVRFAKKQKREKKTRPDWQQLATEQERLNTIFRDTLRHRKNSLEEPTMWEDVTAVAQEILKSWAPQQEPKPKKPYISEETWRLIQDRAEKRRQGLLAEAQELQKAIRKAAKNDRQRWQLEQVEGKLDKRDTWLGLKMMKKRLPQDTMKKSQRMDTT